MSSYSYYHYYYYHYHYSYYYHYYYYYYEYMIMNTHEQGRHGSAAIAHMYVGASHVGGCLCMCDPLTYSAVG